MLVRKEDLTNKMYEEANLLAFYEEEDFNEDYPYQTVTIVKNRYTGIVGLISLREYREIKESYEPEPEENKTEEFEELLDNIGSVFENIFNNITSAGEEFLKEASKIKEELKPDFREAKEDILGGLSNAKTVGRIIALNTIRLKAIEEDVATKGFIKKIDLKLAALEMSL